jgi:hypothetical protein
MHHVNNCDFSGIHMLENVVRAYRDRGGDVFFARPNNPVYDMMCSSEFIDQIGADHIVNDEEAIPTIFYKHLDPAVCIYECPLRVFKECQNLPKRIDIADIPLESEISDQHIIDDFPAKGVAASASAIGLWQSGDQIGWESNLCTLSMFASRVSIGRGTLRRRFRLPLAKVLSDQVDAAGGSADCACLPDRTAQPAGGGCFAEQRVHECAGDGRGYDGLGGSRVAGGGG